MIVDVKAAGHLRLRMPNQQAEMRVECAPASTVTDILAQLGVTPQKVSIVRVNGQSVDLNHRLSEGDQIELFPLIGGG